MVVLQNLTRDQGIKQLGPGGFQLAGPQVDLQPILEMTYKHYYNRTIRRTQKPKQLLLKAHLQIYQQRQHPRNSPGTDYPEKIFYRSSSRSYLYRKYAPWRYSSSTKWIPICWRTPLFFQRR
jgi:hypothetical protein